MSKVKQRCAVIGMGIGKGHAQSYASHQDAELVALVDLDPSRLEPWRDQVEHNALFSDYKAMLSAVKPDLVSVCLPNNLHAPVTIDCLEAGCHVLCEKPMALHVGEAEKMREIARQKGKQLGINLSYRFTPQAQALKRYVDSGALGEVYHGYTRWMRRDGFPNFGGWFGQKALAGGGPLIDLGVHRLDLAIWLMGSPRPVTVSGTAHERIGVPRGQAVGKPFDVEDLACGMVRFDNGASLVFEVSWAGHQRDKEDMVTRVMGTKGTAVHYNTDGGYTFAAEAYGSADGTFINQQFLPIPHAQAANAIANMVDCLAEGREVDPGAEAGINIQRVLDGLYTSSAQAREVEV